MILFTVCWCYYCTFVSRTLRLSYIHMFTQTNQWCQQLVSNSQGRHRQTGSQASCHILTLSLRSFSFFFFFFNASNTQKIKQRQFSVSSLLLDTYQSKTRLVLRISSSESARLSQSLCRCAIKTITVINTFQIWQPESWNCQERLLL